MRLRCLTAAALAWTLDQLLSSGGTLTNVFAGSAPSAFYTSREDSTFEPNELYMHMCMCMHMYM